MLPANPVHRVRDVAPSEAYGAPPWSGWQAVVPLHPLVLSVSGAPARQRTEVRIVRSGSVLLVRFDAEDRCPWSTFVRRDDPLWEEEAVEVFLAPGERQPSRYLEFEVNPRGALFDAAVHNPDSRRETMRTEAGWDCPGIRWAAGASSGGWWAELWIPTLPLLDGAGDPGAWRANFYRIDRPPGDAAELTAWSPTLAEPPDFHKPERFGVLRTEGSWTDIPTDR